MQPNLVNPGGVLEMLVSIALVVLAAAPAPVSALEAALGMRLPRWGMTVAQLERELPNLQEHQPHGCPNEYWSPDTRELRDPGISVGGVPVRFVDFEQGPHGLDGVLIDLGPGGWRSYGVRLSKHLEKHLGPPAERRSELLAIWRFRTALVVAFGTSIFIVAPGSKTEKTLEELLPKAEDLRPEKGR